MMHAEERRSHPRFSVDQFVDISFMREDFIPVEGVNLSENGFLVRSENPLEPYTKIYFMLTVSGDSIQGEGLSIHSDQDGSTWLTGVHIVDMKSTDKARLQAYLKTLG